MNKYYAIAMLAAIKSVESNGDELEKIRRLAAKHGIGYNQRNLEEAVAATTSANAALFVSMRLNGSFPQHANQAEIKASLKKAAE